MYIECFLRFMTIIEKTVLVQRLKNVKKNLWRVNTWKIENIIKV